MRKLNAILTALILLLFLLHAILGSFQLIGIGSTAVKAAAWVCVGLIAMHTILGVILTVDTLRAQKRAGVAYWKENRLFWARRISGLSIMVLLAFHFTAFNLPGGEQYRLRPFGGRGLALQLLLVAAIALHVLMNVRPMLIAFGVRSLKERAADILFVLSVLLLFMAAALIIYYLRWYVW